MEVVVYTMDHCGYCMQAKALLKRRGVPFREILVPMDDSAQWAELKRRSGMKTMPQIFHGEKLLGGYHELAGLDRVDELASLRPT